MHGRLDVERNEVAAGDQAGKLGESVIFGEHSAALRGGHGHNRTAAEQRLLLGIDDGHAHLLARLQNLIHKLLGIFAVQHLTHLDRGGLALRSLAHQLEHARQMRIETILRKRLGDGLRAKRRERRTLKIQGEIQVAHDGGHLAAGERRLAVLLHALLLLAAQLVDMLVDALEAAVGAQQLRRGFVAHARHAGDVVGAVALQSQEIGELRRLHAVALAYLAGAVDGHVGDALARGDHVRELGAQLIDILIARDQQRAIPQRLVARRHGSQNIVAFPARHAHHGDTHGFEQLLDDGELRLQARVHGRTLRLVLLERLGAELRAPGIEGAHDGVGIGDVDELEQHGYEAEHRVGGRAVRGVHGRRHRVEGAVHQRVAVDDGHFLLRHRASFRLVALSHHYISGEGKAAPTAS